MVFASFFAQNNLSGPSIVDFYQYGNDIAGGNMLDGGIQQFHISTDGQVVAGSYSYLDPSTFSTTYNFKIYRYNSSTNTWNTEFEFPTPPITTTSYISSYLTPDGLNAVFVKNAGNYDTNLVTYSGGSWSNPTTIVSAPNFVYRLCLNNTADRLFVAYNSASGTVPYYVDVWDKSGGGWNASATATFNTYYSSDLVCDGTGDQVVFANLVDNSGRGKVYIYDFSSGSWTESKTYTGGFTSSNLGARLEMSDDGNTLIIGSPSYNVGGNSDRGAVNVYTRTSGTWGSTDYYSAQGTSNNQRLGIWVGLTRDGTRIAYGDDANPANVPIQVYDITGGSAVFQESINVHTDTGNISFRSPNYLLYAIQGDPFGSGSNNTIRTLTKIS